MPILHWKGRLGKLGPHIPQKQHKVLTQADPKNRNHIENIVNGKEHGSVPEKNTCKTKKYMFQGKKISSNKSPDVIIIQAIVCTQEEREVGMNARSLFKDRIQRKMRINGNINVK